MVPGEPEHKLTVATTVGQLVELARNQITIGPRHATSVCSNRAILTGGIAGAETSAKHPQDTFKTA